MKMIPSNSESEEKAELSGSKRNAAIRIIGNRQPKYSNPASITDWGLGMEDMVEFIRNVMQNMIDKSRHGAFRSEDQIQGYFEGRAKNLLPAECEYVVERRTTAKYVRKLGYLEKSERGRQGRFDAVVKSTSGRTAAIEMQYPRGKGANRDLFMSHVKNDLLKLTDEQSLDERYLLIFTYSDLPDEGELKRLAADAGTVNLCRIRLAKQAEDARTKPVVNVLTVPEGWISFDQIQ